MSFFANREENAEPNTVSRSPREYGSDVLAFVGDGVFGMMAREYLAVSSRVHAGELHSRAVAMVRCEAQAAYMERLLPCLTEEEAGVFRRGRNYHAAHTPRRNVAAYRAATGLEALFGYLYLCGREERLRELFAYCITEDSETRPEDGIE
ncbi:MAG: ribonuclease III [Clostridia bacterium]|nr:ribonuclease III [Clostridia bacterium]